MFYARLLDLVTSVRFNLDPCTHEYNTTDTNVGLVTDHPLPNQLCITPHTTIISTDDALPTQLRKDLSMNTRTVVVTDSKWSDNKNDKNMFVLHS